MKTVIIDDEEDARRSVRFYLNKYLPICEIVGEANGVRSGVKIIESVNPDVVFLDISMNDGTGFDLLNQLPSQNFHLIFVTGYDEYAIKAFKYSALDYLLKPIDSDDFILLQQKLNTPINPADINQRVKLLQNQIKTSTFDRIAIPNKEGTQFIEIKNIIHLESDGNYTIINLINKSKILITRILKEFEALLDTSVFFRSHRSHIINISHVDRFKLNEDIIVLRGDKEIPVSRRRKQELKKRLGM